MLERLGTAGQRRPKTVLLATLLLVIIAAALSSKVASRLSNGGLGNPAAASARAANVLQDRFRQGDANLVLLVEDPRGVDNPAAVQTGTRLTQRLAAEPGVVDVISYWTAGHAPEMRSRTGNRAVIFGHVAGDPDQVDRRIATLEPAYHVTTGGARVTVGGIALALHEMNAQAKTDAVRGEMIVFPITLVVLFLVFGSLLAALLPLIVAVVTIMLTLFLMWALTQVTDVSFLVLNMATFLGLGLAIDYNLLFVSRFREEIDGGATPAEAVRATIRTAGRTVLFSALTVAAALSGLLVFPFFVMQSLAFSAIAASLLAAGSTLVVTPALLTLAGRRVANRSFRFGKKRERGIENGFWHRLAMVVMARPILVASLVIAFLLVLGLPFLRLNLRLPDEQTLPASSQSYQVANAVQTGFPVDQAAAIQVVAPDAGAARPDQIAAYAGRLSGLPHVAEVDAVTGRYVRGAQTSAASPLTSRYSAGGATYLVVVPTGDAYSAAAKNLVHQIRAAPAPFGVLVGGLPAEAVDTFASLGDALPLMALVTGLAMFLLLFLLTGSLVLPLIAIVLTTLSLTATFGALVWIFQDGRLMWLVGDFTVNGSIYWTIPLALFGLAFGLSMDYQVFLFARIAEEYRRTGDPTRAVAFGLERIGRIITAAALLISIVFLAFIPSKVSYMKAFGLGLPLAVLMDATLIRGALLPALMRLGGRYVWWAPRPLRALQARVNPADSSPSQVSPRPPATSAVSHN
jgi:RND superfamily putative drug exporter